MCIFSCHKHKHDYMLLYCILFQIKRVFSLVFLARKKLKESARVRETFIEEQLIYWIDIHFTQTWTYSLKILCYLPYLRGNLKSQLDNAILLKLLLDTRRAVCLVSLKKNHKLCEKATLNLLSTDFGDTARFKGAGESDRVTGN